MELTEADTASSKSYTEIFDEQLPFYISLGMSATEYWEGDTALPYFYRKAWKMKSKYKADHENYLAWLQGMYIADAISSCFGKNHHYPKEPYELKTPEQPKTKAEEQKIVKKAALGFAEFVAAKNAEFKRKNESKPAKEPDKADNLSSESNNS